MTRKRACTRDGRLVSERERRYAFNVIKFGGSHTGPTVSSHSHITTKYLTMASVRPQTLLFEKNSRRDAPSLSCLVLGIFSPPLMILMLAGRGRRRPAAIDRC